MYYWVSEQATKNPLLLLHSVQAKCTERELQVPATFARVGGARTQGVVLLNRLELEKQQQSSQARGRGVGREVLFLGEVLGSWQKRGSKIGSAIRGGGLRTRVVGSTLRCLGWIKSQWSPK